METGSTGIRFDFGSLYLGAPYNGSSRLRNSPDQNESFLTNRLTIFYRISSSPITLSLAVPYVTRKSHEPSSDIVSAQTFESNGIGDLVAQVRYIEKQYIDESMVAYSVGVGAKLSTGRSDVKIASGEYLNPDLQPGTGTTDILITGSGFWSLDRTGLGANITAGIVTGRGAPSSDGGYHKYGNYFNGELTARYRIVPEELSEANLSLTLGLGGETRAHETLGGNEIAASCGSIIYVAPGVKYILSTRISADAVVQIPVYQYLFSDPVNSEYQLGESYRFIAGIQYSL
ncbi:MAG: hypothetical protein Q8896_00530 [Bacteroidota bacterium]|nr:hypothetical protein [Bacteroidota bacterium]